MKHVKLSPNIEYHRYYPWKLLITNFNLQISPCAGVEDAHMRVVEWENSMIHELELSSTELSSETLMDVLLRCPGFSYLGLGYCEFFNDKVPPARMHDSSVCYC
jgi:hypothetical protein